MLDKLWYGGWPYSYILGLPENTNILEKGQEELEKILEMDLSMDPLLFLLDVFPDHMLSTDKCYILHVLLMIA